MEIIKRSDHDAVPTELRTATFTGVVYGDALRSGADGVAVTSVFFAPGARTYWHSHANGQLLHVMSGSGLIGTAAGIPRPLAAGDLVWAPPGELHWHGGGPESMLLHLAVSLGTTSWQGPVSEEDYGAGQ
jgi:quercetin dioxygenase-like cupin family protein